MITVDPKEYAIISVKSDEKQRRETVATLAKRYHALAGINGGFWKKNGNPAGILKIAGKWHGTPTKPRGAIGWSLNHSKVIIDRVLTSQSLKECKNQAEIKVIPVSLPPLSTQEEWEDMEFIVGGTPLLITNGLSIEDHSSEQTLESFLLNRYPRTAVGITKNGDWIFVVVDGYFFGFLGGMTIKELTDLMKELGSVKALNLDGGGSSTLVLEGIVINEPCGTKKEGGKLVEEVSDAILILDTRP